MYDRTLDTLNLNDSHYIDLRNISLNQNIKVKYILDTLFYHLYPHNQLNKYIKLYSNDYKLYFNDDIIKIKDTILFLRLHLDRQFLYPTEITTHKFNNQQQLSFQ